MNRNPFWRSKRQKTFTDLIDFLVLEEGKEERARPITGAAIVGGGDALLPVAKEAPTVFTDDGRSTEFFWWGGVRLPLSAARGHSLYIGTTGAGKSQLLSITMRDLLRTIRPGTDRRAIIFDTKGDVLEILHGMEVPYTLMNINDSRAAAWDIAKDCQSYIKAEELAHIFIPESKASDPFWADSARAILSGVMCSFIYRRGTDWRLSDVVNACLSDNPTLIDILKQFPQNEGLIAKLLSTEAGTTQAGIGMQLYTTMARLMSAAAHSQNARTLFSLREFIETEGVLVVAPDLEARETVKPIAQAMFRVLTDLITGSSDSETRQTFIFIDESRFLGKLPGLLDLNIFGRSRGACVFLSTQVVEGFYEIYGRNEAEEIFGTCNFKTVLKTNSPVTAKWATELFGAVEVWDTVISSSSGQGGLSVSNNKQRVKRERVLDSEILGLPIATPEKGIHAFFLSPLTDAYKEVIPGNVIEGLKPRKVSVPRQISKPKEEQMLHPWTREEREAFLNVQKLPERESPTTGARKRNVRTEIREGVFDRISEVVIDAMEKLRKSQERP